MTDAETGQRVVLVRRVKAMVPYHWTGAEPEGMYQVDVAEGLGATWEGDELVTYDLPGLVALYEYHQGNEYLIDND
ncbi:MAG TPA: hypothetical protein VFO60_05110 [Candidatus Dormibacteraeota bacterium]|nr:hypothetical protein [Candidatus Dormibacteraeota bacterium]